MGKFYHPLRKSLQFPEPGLPGSRIPGLRTMIAARSLSDEAPAKRSPHSIFIKEKERFRKIDFTAILFVEASGSYCHLYLEGGRYLTLSFTLAEITPKLSAVFFQRVHRSYIVNVDRIDAFIGNTLYIGQHRIPVSKRHRPEVMEQFNILGNPR